MAMDLQLAHPSAFEMGSTTKEPRPPLLRESQDALQSRFRRALFPESCEPTSPSGFFEPTLRISIGRHETGRVDPGIRCCLALGRVSGVVELSNFQSPLSATCLG